MIYTDENWKPPVTYCEPNKVEVQRMNKQEAIDIITGLYRIPVENGADEFASEINKAIDMAIAALQDAWIPVWKDGYVPDYEVMCQDKYGNMMIGYVDVDEYGDWMCEDDGTIMNDVIAWQPLPDPYKGGDTE